MIVTRTDARRIIARHYGPDFAFRVTARSCTLGVRPVTDPRPTLAWMAVAAGRDSAVRIGVLRTDLSIDWSANV